MSSWAYTIEFNLNPMCETYILYRAKQCSNVQLYGNFSATQLQQHHNFLYMFDCIQFLSLFLHLLLHGFCFCAICIGHRFYELKKIWFFHCILCRSISTSIATRWKKLCLFKKCMFYFWYLQMIRDINIYSDLLDKQTYTCNFVCSHFLSIFRWFKSIITMYDYIKKERIFNDNSM